MTLVIMAAGMGSRFGGLKQIEPIGPNGEFIIDYSIYDAIKAGFTKVVFIIKKENHDIFRDTIGKRIEGKIDVEYVFQDYSNVPNDIKIPSERIKPLGTGHAILCAKNKVNEPFLIINADDFYGYEAYESAKKFIENNDNENNYGLITFKLGNTLTSNGEVKRGVCTLENGFLKSINESRCINKDDGIFASPLNGDDSYYTSFDTPVSVNLFVFYPNSFNYLENDFLKFLNNSNNLLEDEFFLPTVLSDHVKNKDITCQVVKSDAIWKGITFKGDLNSLKEYINNCINEGKYPNNLYV